MASPGGVLFLSVGVMKLSFYSSLGKVFDGSNRHGRYCSRATTTWKTLSIWLLYLYAIAQRGLFLCKASSSRYNISLTLLQYRLRHNWACGVYPPHFECRLSPSIVLYFSTNWNAWSPFLQCFQAFIVNPQRHLFTQKTKIILAVQISSWGNYRRVLHFGTFRRRRYVGSTLFTRLD
jgi:hypothetical protein